MNSLHQESNVETMEFTTLQDESAIPTPNNCTIGMCCRRCGITFSKRCNLKRHFKKQHPESSYETVENVAKPVKMGLECKRCGIAFSKMSNLKRHNKTRHPESNNHTVQNLEIYSQNVTQQLEVEDVLHLDSENKAVESVEFASTNDSIMPVPNNKEMGIYCSRCNITFTCKSHLNRHNKRLHPEHSIQTEERLVFNSHEEFKSWMYELQKTTCSKFVRSTGAKRTSNGAEVSYYTCYRNGVYKPKQTQKRHLKIKGSVKIGNVCPARIKVTKTIVAEATKFTVLYKPTHAGHLNDLGFLTLVTPEKEVIAGQMAHDNMIRFEMCKHVHKVCKLYPRDCVVQHDNNLEVAELNVVFNSRVEQEGEEVRVISKELSRRVETESFEIQKMKLVASLQAAIAKIEMVKSIEHFNRANTLVKRLHNELDNSRDRMSLPSVGQYRAPLNKKIIPQRTLANFTTKKRQKISSKNSIQTSETNARIISTILK